MANRFHATRPEPIEIDGKVYQFKSLLEKQFALMLPFVYPGARWDYEPETFTLGTHKRGAETWKPDFVVWLDLKLVIECKGYLSSKAVTQARRLRENNPNLKIIFVARRPESGKSQKSQLLKKRWDRLKKHIDNVWYIAADLKTLGLDKVT